MIFEYEVCIFDMCFEGEFVFNCVFFEFELQFVGVIVMMIDCYQVKVVFQIVKDMFGFGVFMMVGGYYFIFLFYEFEVDCVDVVCLGEGEDIFFEVIEYFDKGGVFIDLYYIDGLYYCSVVLQWNISNKCMQVWKFDIYLVLVWYLIE